MARSNKYTSLNFNEIYEKKLNSNNSSTSSPAFANQSKTNSRIHGHMLVLSRPVPKPISTPQKPENKEKDSPLSVPDQPRTVTEPDDISLRPQGRTGSGPLLTSSPLTSPVKSDRFVPPHLRPGFVSKEENPVPEFVKGRLDPVPFQGGSRLNRYGEDGRPKSGGGYEQQRRGGEPGHLNRSDPKF